MNISYNDLCSTDCLLYDISSYHHMWDGPTEYNYETNGRVNNLLYYQLDNEITYYVKGKIRYQLNKHDIIFIPHGFKYSSFVSAKEDNPASGIGITFNLETINRERIDFFDSISIITKDKDGQLYQKFKKILYSVLHPSTNALKLKGQLYTLLDDLFSDKGKKDNNKKIRDDISNAISIIENYPQKSYTNKQLAEACFMSESSFLRKFKQYSDGITPLQYRNNIRLMRAEDLIYTTKTIDEIAELLGFYDGAHLCRIYKSTTGHTLKRKNK
ncbi:MAG: helix-turn-helix transcriptional regulator [Clostridia bacterium]|nr:helix-turn-helix transcriptional regulator [Clostridia bacterium]